MAALRHSEVQYRGYSQWIAERPSPGAKLKATQTVMYFLWPLDGQGPQDLTPGLGEVVSLSPRDCWLKRISMLPRGDMELAQVGWATHDTGLCSIVLCIVDG